MDVCMDVRLCRWGLTLRGDGRRSLDSARLVFERMIMNTPKTDHIFGHQAVIEKRVGHGAKDLCESLEIENAKLREALKEAADCIRHRGSRTWLGLTQPHELVRLDRWDALLSGT